MRVSTLQGPNLRGFEMSLIGDWLLSQPPYVGLPLTFGLSLLTGLVGGAITLKILGRK